MPGKRKGLWGAAAGRMGKRKVLLKTLREHKAPLQCRAAESLKKALSDCKASAQ